MGQTLSPKRFGAGVAMNVTTSATNGTNVFASSLQSRLRGALWGFFAGDALAAPSHWYYGGSAQIQRDYGREGITEYSKPVMKLPGSIMNKSNVNGGGRGSFGKDRRTGKSIIGDIINHGKLEYWNPNNSIHYHATLQKGENTLEAQLARVLMKSIVANDGKFNQEQFRKSYVAFMTTKGSHNDTYASTCHRMFFANWFFDKKDPENCPDNDHHNVDTIDGLVLPTITALAYIGRNTDLAAIQEAAACTAATTRQSAELENYSSVWARHVLLPAITATTPYEMKDSWNTAARLFGMKRNPKADARDEMSACYLQLSLPATMDMLSKYGLRHGANVEMGLLANANLGGENVHRGSILGAVLGGMSGEEAIKDTLKRGLHDYEEIRSEIDDFVKVVVSAKKKSLTEEL